MKKKKITGSIVGQEDGGAPSLKPWQALTSSRNNNAADDDRTCIIAAKIRCDQLKPSYLYLPVGFIIWQG